MTVRRPARPLLALSAAIGLALSFAPAAFAGEAQAARPLRGLLVTGGGYHDYKSQENILTEGVSARTRIEWTIVRETSMSNGHRIPLYENPNWADGYDVVVHNECYADVTDPAYIGKILDAHKKGTPAIVVHCAMHTYRSLKSDEYREFLGVSTFRHGKQHPLDVKTLQPEHPIMKGFPTSWVTGNEELDWIEKVWPGTTALAQAKAEENKKDNAVIWVHNYGKGKVFGTTLAHNNKTMSDPVYLDMFTRGLLWACDKLEEDGKPKAGFGPSAARQ
jgi:type 1 glutamine amidotransferase